MIISKSKVFFKKIFFSFFIDVFFGVFRRIFFSSKKMLHYVAPSRIKNALP